MTENLASYIDQTLLKPESTPDDVRKLVADARELQVFGVCVSPSLVTVAKQAAAGSELAVVTVCGFPSGAVKAEVKATEAALSVSEGADEVDMVINVGAAVSGDFALVEAEIAAVRAAVPAPARLKVIVESAALTDEQLTAVCQAATRAGADFVKTSTGFHPSGGATVHAVEVMAAAIGPDVKIKASGGIRTREDAEAMIAAGASRLGLSSARAVLEGSTATGSY
ncbi:deoxyribose-phosphate aldolase [Kineosporia rhizophila]|uniref:deoxyribose-phosphate aldolase n=1 Tax=Kineosporia TaxID=49184 RepID=UPI001E578874|nr:MULTISPECIES: deoxyribose-phosphate aldolase [Kineosporia]MCE0536347.1 deoxyribose-phosphate aldolase [Kineosporia rhizophila]GLY19822.1 deoxyribose-phosphate aldolase [Kineosporia sp. NBRC 101677]